MTSLGYFHPWHHRNSLGSPGRNGDRPKLSYDQRALRPCLQETDLLAPFPYCHALVRSAWAVIITRSVVCASSTADMPGTIISSAVLAHMTCRIIGSVASRGSRQ